MKKLIFFIFTFLIISASLGQTNTQNYLLKNVGYISIPNTMEIQGGNYKKLAEEYQKESGRKFGYEVSENRIVFQQKGLNDGAKPAYASYARIIIETIVGSYGDFEKLTTKLSASSSEIAELNSQLKKQVAELFSGTGLKLISWYGTEIETINGRTALKISYLRQLKDNPLVIVSMYQFQNNDRMHQLTFSYRQQETAKWKSAFSKALTSFKITNIR